MKNKILIALPVILVAAVAILFGPKLLIKHDLKIICDLSEEYAPRLADKENFNIQALVEYSEKRHRAILHPHVKDVLKVLTVVEASQKRQVFEQGLSELGHPGWKCPAFEKIHFE